MLSDLPDQEQKEVARTSRPQSPVRLGLAVSRRNQSIPSPRDAAKGGRDGRPTPEVFPARGRGTSSPPQFGQMEFMAAAQSPQNVHSKAQM
jgi:hypothetical protein